MSFKYLLATGVLALGLASPATASAVEQPQVTKVCGKTHPDADGTFEVWASARTSCGMAKATLRRIYDLDAMPRRLRVKSPVTGRTYTLRRTHIVNELPTWFSVTYTAPKYGIAVQAFLDGTRTA
jgi:hypothetical protein